MNTVSNEEVYAESFLRVKELIFYHGNQFVGVIDQT